jgi:nitronate monooxygenase
VPRIADAVACPVIAAGGIMDGRGIAAALTLGAAGVQLGTAFLGCPEASVAPPHRAALRAASEDATRISTAFTGKPACVLANRYVLETADAEADALPFPLQRGLSGPLAQASVDFMPFYVGRALVWGANCRPPSWSRPWSPRPSAPGPGAADRA